MKLKPILFIVMFLVLTSSIFALGITPSRKIIDFKQDLHEEITFKVVNNEQKDMNIIIYPKGDLAQYVTLDTKSAHIKADETGINVKYRIDIPYSERNSGNNVLEIVVEETNSGNPQQKMLVGKLAVTHQLVMRAPTQGKFANIIFSANNPGMGENLAFSFYLSNAGTEDITEFIATVEVFNSKEESIGVANYNFNSLAAGENRKETKIFGIAIPPDTYKAVAKIFYAGKEIDAETSFFVVGPYIEILGIEANNFKLGGINEMKFHVTNLWNKAIPYVFADVVVKDENNNIKGVFRTQTQDIQPNEETILTGYWDTKDVRTGTYTLSVMLSYEGKISQRDFIMEVSENGVKISKLQITGSAVVEKTKGGNSVVPILVVSFLILVIVNIFLILYIRKAKKPPINSFIILINAVIFAVTLNLIRIF